MRIALFNVSTYAPLTFAIVTQIANVIQKQIDTDVASMWQFGPMEFFAVSSIDNLDADVSPLIIKDEASAPGVLGDHYTTGGRPIGEVLLQPILQTGGSLLTGSNSLSTTSSHEGLEMVLNPYIGDWADMGDGKTEDAKEMCDRVEGDSYVVDGVSVSDFLGPRAFDPTGPGPYDMMGLLQSAFEIRSTGYAIRRTGGPGGSSNAVFGASYPEARKALKLRHGSRAGRLVTP